MGRRPVGTGPSTTALLVLACVAIGLPFAALLDLPLPIWAGQPSPRSTPLPPDAIGWAEALAALGFSLILCLVYRPYLLARDLANRPLRPRLLVLLTALLALVGLLMYPRFGSDVFDYAAYERMWAVYGDNPLSTTLAAHPADWTTPFVNVADRAPAYGPVWALLTWPIVRLAGDSAFSTVLGYKMLSAAAYVACCWFIWNTVAPERRPRALIGFAWSPLVLFEALGKVHNDSLSAASILCLIWLAERTHERIGMLVGVVGGLIKGTALAAMPTLALRLWQHHGWRGLLPVSAGCLVLGALLYAPFWSGPNASVAMWSQTGSRGWSLTTLLEALAEHASGARLELVVRIGLGLLWAGLVVLILRAGRVDSSMQLATSSGWLFVASVLLLTAADYAHYFVPAVALAAVAGDAIFDRVVLWLCIGALAVYAVGALGWVFEPAGISRLDYLAVGSFVLLCPAAVAAILTRRRPSEARR